MLLRRGYRPVEHRRAESAARTRGSVPAAGLRGRRGDLDAGYHDARADLLPPHRIALGAVRSAEWRVAAPDRQRIGAFRRHRVSGDRGRRLELPTGIACLEAVAGISRPDIYLNGLTADPANIWS